MLMNMKQCANCEIQIRSDPIFHDSNKITENKIKMIVIANNTINTKKINNKLQKNVDFIIFRILKITNQRRESQKIFQVFLCKPKYIFSFQMNNFVIRMDGGDVLMNITSHGSDFVLYATIDKMKIFSLENNANLVKYGECLGPIIDKSKENIGTGLIHELVIKDRKLYENHVKIPPGNNDNKNFEMTKLHKKFRDGRRWKTTKYFITYEHPKIIRLCGKSKELFLKIMLSDEINKLFDLFKNNNFDIRITGGAVRDILMEIEPHDIDFVTNATSTEMKAMFRDNNIRMVNNNGESHGTVTVRINDKENFEITTLRYDKVTDGRRAEVVFVTDWKIDAERRDFTINSMFLDKDGFVYDYTSGIDDIENHKVRFVKDTEKRIQEDYLRILRYFRFYGQISKNRNKHLKETIIKIIKNGSLLRHISGERIWSEMRRILKGKYAVEIIDIMRKCKILSYLGLPEDPSLIELKLHYKIIRKNDSNPSVFLSTLFENESELRTAWERLNLSNNELICSRFILTRRKELTEIIKNNSKEDIIKYFKKDFIMHTGEPSLSKLKITYHEFFKYVNRLDLWKSFSEWEPPKFPVRGDVLAKEWGLKGKMIGLGLLFLKSKWVDSEFTATSEKLVGCACFRENFLK